MMTVRLAPAGEWVLILFLLTGIEGASADIARRPPVDYREGLGARFDTAAVPAPPKRGGYKVGQRVVYTIWLDNDDPSDGMRDLFIWMPRPPAHMRLDLRPNQPAYGNIFYDSGIPDISDTPARCRMYYISKPEGETRPLTPGTDSDAVRDVVWVITRGSSEQVVSPHTANDNVYAVTRAKTRRRVTVDADELYVRYALIVVDKPEGATDE